MNSEEKRERREHYRKYFREYKKQIKQKKEKKSAEQQCLKFSFGVNMIPSANKLKFLSSDGSKRFPVGPRLGHSHSAGP